MIEKRGEHTVHYRLTGCIFNQIIQSLGFNEHPQTDGRTDQIQEKRKTRQKTKKRERQTAKMKRAKRKTITDKGTDNNPRGDRQIKADVNHEREIV